MNIHTTPYVLIDGDCRELLKSIPTASVDFVLSDPPYPHVDRDYGTWTAAEWLGMMQEAVPHLRRVLRPRGSCVLVIQPNSEGIGNMRPWAWDFVSWAIKEWNLVEDVYWWNHAALPGGHVIQGKLLRPSVKWCVWLGPADCYRNQAAVLWAESDSNKAKRLAARFTGRHSGPSGQGYDIRRATAAAGINFGGVTPFNLLPFANTNSSNSAGAHGHGAGTPDHLCNWWLRYACPRGGVVLDAFSGTATVGVSAIKSGRSYIGMEVLPRYNAIGRERLAQAIREKKP